MMFVMIFITNVIITKKLISSRKRNDLKLSDARIEKITTVLQ
jgi:hypothetical protein